MKFKTLLILNILFVLLSASSCKPKRLAPIIEEEEKAMVSESTVIIKPEERGISSFPLSKLIEDVEYIQLETSEEAAMSNPTNVKFASGIFYISDIDERIMCFDLNGKFIRKAYKKGKGTGEVIRMYDYDVDETYLYILDGAKSSIIKFDHDGKFIEEKKLPFRAIRFSLLSNGYIFQLAPYTLDNGDEPYQIAITDMAFNIKEKKLSYRIEDANPVSRTPFFAKTKSSVIFAPIYCRSIYFVNSEFDMYMKYYIDFQTQYYEQSKNINGAKEADIDNIYYTYDSPLVDSNYILQYFVTSPEKKGLLVIDRRNNEYAFIKEIDNDLSTVYKFNISLTKEYNADLGKFLGFSNQYYTMVHLSDVKTIRESMPDSVASIIVKEGASFDANPTLMLYRLREDISASIN